MKTIIDAVAQEDFDKLLKRVELLENHPYHYRFTYAGQIAKGLVHCPMWEEKEKYKTPFVSFDGEIVEMYAECIGEITRGNIQFDIHVDEFVSAISDFHLILKKGRQKDDIQVPRGSGIPLNRLGHFGIYISTSKMFSEPCTAIVDLVVKCRL